MDLEHAYFFNESQRYVDLGSRWLRQMLGACVNTWYDVTRKCWNFKTNSAFSHTENLFDSISVGARN